MIISLKMYGGIRKKRDIPSDDRVISLKRPEWQQPADILPPLYKRLAGQRRRRVLGSFPETENDVSIENNFYFLLENINLIDELLH